MILAAPPLLEKDSTLWRLVQALEDMRNEYRVVTKSAAVELAWAEVMQLAQDLLQ